MSRRLTVFAAALALSLAAPLLGATTDFRFLLNVDRDVASGCAVGGMNGIDVVFTTRVETTSDSGRVTQTFVRTCLNGTLGGEVIIDDTGWNAGSVENLTIESKLPFSAFGSQSAAQTMVIGIEAVQGSRTQEVDNDASGSPIVFPKSVSRRRAVASPGNARSIVLDGNGSDWRGLDPIVDGLASSGSPGLRMTRLYGLADATRRTLYLRVDANLSAEVPFAADDHYMRPMGQGATVAAPGVLANDLDPNGLPLTASAVTVPASGNVTLNPDGSFTYVPDDATATTSDSFEYRATNGTRSSAPARVTIDVASAANAAPVAHDDSYATDEDVSLSVAAPGVLANDTDADADPLSATLLAAPSHGMVILHPNGGFTYVPSTDFAGSDSFTYTVTDGVGTDTATVHISVESVDDAPTAFDQLATTSEDVPVGIVLAGSDEEGSPLTFNVGTPAHGALTGVAPNVTYTPDANFNGNDAFPFTVNDGALTSNTAIVNISVSPVNDTPSFTAGGNVTVAEDSGAYSAAWATAIHRGAANESAQSLSFQLSNNNNALFLVQPAIASDGTLTFTPALNAHGSAALTVTLSDNGGGANTSAPQGFTLTVLPVNDAPVVTPAAFSVDENSSNGTSVGSVAFTDADALDAHTYALTSGNLSGAFAIHPTTGAITVANSSALDFESTPSFSLTVSVTDNSGAGNATGSATITVTLNNRNEAPTANDASFTVAENAANATAVGTVSATDPDVGQTLTYSITGGNTGGAFAINASSGAITVANASALNFETLASYTLTVTATDNGSGALSDTASITIQVTNVNEAPVVNAATVSLAENSANGTPVHTVTFTEPDTTGQTHTFAITAGNASGAFAIDSATGAITVADGTLLNFEGTPSFALTVTVTDAGAPLPAASGSAVMTVNLTNVNEPPSVTSPAAVSVPENQTSVITVTATDAEAGSLTYSLTGGADQAAFTINPTTGALSFVAPRDFELPFDADANNVYLVQVTVSDGTNNAVQNLSVTVTNVNEAPSITSAPAFSVPENTGPITFVTATDPEGASITWSVTGGADAARLSIDSSSGQLSFTPPPDFEAPADVDSNNVYVVQVSASDGTNATPQTITLTVTNVDEPLAFTTPATVSVPENDTAIMTVHAADPESGAVTYSITGGDDQIAFAVDTNTGVLTWVAPRNFELPFDADTNNVYLVQITASDGANSIAQNLSVTVTDVNEAPSITSAPAASVPENTTTLSFLTATDPEGATLAWSITGGTDAADFSVNPTTGELTFTPAPNFEAPADADTNNVYIVIVAASDGSNTTTQTLTLTITDVNEAPAFTSSATVSVPEETTTVVTVQATDPEAASVTYSLSGGADQSAFSINSSSGALTFIFPPDFEAPTDADANNQYLVQVSATDGVNPVTQNLVVTVTNVNDAPYFTTSNSVSVPENTTAVTTVGATDPEGSTVTFSLAATADGPEFSIDANTGVLTFHAPPDYEAPTGVSGFLYVVNVNASDGTTSAQQTLLVTVTNVDEPPAFSSPSSVSVSENTTSVVTVQAVDPEGAIPTYSITGGADQAKFTIDGTTGALSFLSAPDFETPTDADANNVYIVQVTANDTNPAVQTISVTVLDANDPPVFTSSATPSVAENSTVVIDVDAFDPESGTVSYSLTGGADAADFSINGTSGVLSFNVAPNFEAPHDADTNNTYLVQVTATDGTNPAVQNLTVTVTNVNEAPSITSINSVTVAEGAVNVVTVTTSDPESDTITYSTSGGVDQAAFTINASSGALAFVAPANFEAPVDADANNVYLVQVTASDGTNPVNQTITVTVTDVNEGPFFTSSATPSVQENNTMAVNVDAIDPEGASVTYSVTGGADAADFSVDSSTGVLTFLVAPNFEAPHDADTNNIYLVEVTATDGTIPTMQALTVTVTNVNEAPSFTSGGTASIPENTTAAVDVDAVDPDGTTPSYSITGGADATSFSINGTSGVLTFNAAPNFEAPADADANNTYLVQVTATDGVNPVNQLITVTVTNVDESPSFTSSNTATVAENIATPAIDVNAVDPEGAAVTFSITGGADQGDFTINASTGELTFNPSPNFEAPADADANNIYIVQVTATDGTYPVNQTISITVTNVNEAPVNTVPAATQTTPEDTNFSFPGTISVSDPDGNVTVKVTLTVTHGTLSTNGTTGLTFTTGDGVDDPTLVFTGTTTNINARLNGLTYKPTLNFYGTGVNAAQLTILADDQGNTGSGGAQLSNGGTPNAVSINVTPVNDKPTTPSYTVANGNAHITHSGIGITISAADSNELKEDATDVDDHDPYSELTVQIVPGTLSPANATLTLLDASTGAFYFEPPGGLSGSAAASFQYQVCDNGDAGLGLAAQCSDPATVQFTITGADTWFVDDTDAAGCAAACNGSRTKPLAGLNHAALAARGTGDRIFAFSGTYNHGFTMNANESLVGQASTGSFDTVLGVVIPANGTLDTRPTLSGAAVTLQNTLTAANNTVLRGVSIASGANKGYVASGATTLTVLESSVSSTGNMAIDVTGATNAATNVAFSTTTSGGGTRGVSLNGINGTWSLGGGGFTNNTQAGFYLQDSNASTITFSGNISPTGSGRGVLIGTADGNAGANASNGMESGTTITLSGNITAGGVAVYESSGGTLNLTGSNHTWNTATIRGVDLIDNNGATINFSGGNIAISTTTATGFHASQGGTVNVTGAANTITTTAGNAFEAIGTSLEHMGGGYAWRTISSTNGTKGISVQYHDGAFSVSGDGADADTTPDSVTFGGTIAGADQRGAEFIDVDGPVSLGGMMFTNPADTAGPDASVAAGTCGNIPSGGSNTGCFAGIHLDTVSTVSLNTVDVSGSGQIGINGNSIAGLTINTVNVTNSGNTAGEDGIRLYNLSGAGSITSLVVSGSFGKGLLIENTNVALATSGSPYLITNSNFQNSSNAQGANLNTDLTGTMHVKFVNGTISGNFSNGIQTAGLGSGTLGIYVDNTNFSDNTSAMVIQASGGSTVFDVRNADHIGRATNSSYGMGVKADGTGTATGVFFSNVIGNGTAASGGCSGCNGINVDARNSGSITVEIRGNTIRNVGSSGIQLRDGEGSAKVNATVTGNLIKDPDGGAASFAGIFGDSGVLSSDTNCLTAQLGGTTAYPGAPTAAIGEIQNRIEGAWGTAGVRVLKRFGAGAPPEPVFNLPGYDGSGVNTWIQNRNSIAGAATPVSNNTGAGGNFTGAASCP